MARRRRYVRDSHGRFATVPGAPSAPQTAQTDNAAYAAKRAALRRQRAAKAGAVTVAVAVAAVVGASRSQYPARGAMAARNGVGLARWATLIRDHARVSSYPKTDVLRRNRFRVRNQL